MIAHKCSLYIFYSYVKDRNIYKSIIMVVMHGVQTPCIKSQVIDNIYYSISIISLIMVSLAACPRWGIPRICARDISTCLTIPNHTPIFTSNSAVTR